MWFGKIVLSFINGFKLNRFYKKVVYSKPSIEKVNPLSRYLYFDVLANPSGCGLTGIKSHWDKRILISEKLWNMLANDVN